MPRAEEAQIAMPDNSEQEIPVVACGFTGNHFFQGFLGLIFELQLDDLHVNLGPRSDHSNQAIIVYSVSR